MSTKHAIAINSFRGIGLLAILCGLFGFYYNFSTLGTALAGKFGAENGAGFYVAFYLMSLICFVIHGLMFFLGVKIFRRQQRFVNTFVKLLIFEVIYFFSVSLMWMIPSIGMSVAGATGVANGGLMIGFLILLPLWSPFLLKWARRNLPPLMTEQVAVSNL